MTTATKKTSSKNRGLIPPHGGVLVNRVVDATSLTFEIERAASMPRLELSPRGAADVECIGTGVYSPLEGFMGEADHASVVDSMRMTDGTAWPIPITLPAAEDFAAAVDDGTEIALAFDGAVIGTMEVQSRFRPDRTKEAQAVYLTTDAAHPGVAALLDSPPVALAGPIRLFREVPHDDYAGHRFTPARTRAEFTARGWRKVVAFQTRNPVHRAHEYLLQVAIEVTDGLFLNPLMGPTKKGDIPGDARMKTYRAILDNYYPPARTFLGIFPAAMRYAGPREAILHAIARKNYGCSHFIVGRDHAGVGDYYGTYDAQAIFHEFEPGELGIVTLEFEHAGYCRECEQLVSLKTCPHGKDSWFHVSGTKLREMLANGETPPPEFTRPEVARILLDVYKNESDG